MTASNIEKRRRQPDNTVQAYDVYNIICIIFTSRVATEYRVYACAFGRVNIVIIADQLAFVRESAMTELHSFAVIVVIMDDSI